MNRKITRQASVVDLDFGLQMEENLKLRNTPSSTKAFANLVYRKELAQASSLVFENELKLVKDRIPDETWYFAGFLSRTEEQVYRAQPEVWKMERDGAVQFFGIDGGTEVEKRRKDPLLMQNDLINTAKVTWEYLGIDRMVTTARAKVQYDYDFEKDNQHYEVGVFQNPVPSASLQIA